jgi:hypothetical protein
MAAVELWRARTGEGMHEDEDKRHRRLPLVLAVLRRCSSSTGRRQRSRLAAAARLGFGGSAAELKVARVLSVGPRVYGGGGFIG